MAYAETGAHAFQGTEFRIGRVISKSFEVFCRNFITFTLIASVIWLPLIILGVIMGTMQGPEAGAPSTARIAGGVLTFALFMILWPLSTAIILYGAFQSMRGRPVRVWESVSMTLSRILPLIALIVLFGLGIMLGMILLVIPGIILALMWYVAVPVCIVEKAGPIRSLGRSRQLTKGHRWRIMGLGLVVTLLTFLGKVIVTAGVTVLGSEWVSVVSQLLWQGVSGGFSGVLGAVVYYYLRVAKEGVDVEQITAVFD